MAPGCRVKRYERATVHIGHSLVRFGCVMVRWTAHSGRRTIVSLIEAARSFQYWRGS